MKLGKWCPGADLNHRHADFQSAALPTELPGRIYRSKHKHKLRVCFALILKRGILAAYRKKDGVCPPLAK